MRKKDAKHQQTQTDDATIAELKRAVEALVSRCKRPDEVEGIIAEAKALAREWKDPHSAQDPKDRRPLFGDTTTNTTFLLAALVVALSRDHQILERIRRHFPNELEELSNRSLFADVLAAASIWASGQPKPTSKQSYEERKRRRWHRSPFNSIEYQFGGGLEASVKKGMPFPSDTLINSVLPSMQNCLDGIFAGAAVDTGKLEELFRRERHQLYEIFRKRRRQGNYLDVVNVMDFLLNEKPRRKRKSLKAGRPRQAAWLNGDDLRTRVLSGIETRIKSVPVERKIAEAFLTVVQCHLADSGKK